MEECLDRGTSIACRKNAKGESKDPNRYLLHEQWSDSANQAAVCSLPVTVSDQVVAVVSMRRKNDDPFTADEVEKAQGLLEPFAPAILVVERANRTLANHLLDSSRSAWSGLMKPNKIGRKIAALAAIVALLWFMFGTMTYSVTVPCTIAPAEVRHISAPFEAMIADAPARAGDTVVKGQVLVRFDTAQLELERQRLLSELRVSEIEKRNAISQRDLAAAALADANMNVLRSQLETTERQITQSTVRAHVDGIIVKGDLRKRIGQSVRPDETLYELAPSDDWYVELQIPEVHAPYITAGLSGSFATLARPDQPLDCEVERVIPSAEVVDGRNVFLAQTRVPQNPEWMRVGMEGIARIDVGPKPVWWSTMHRTIDYIRLKLWL
ncbi:MAG: efflux RND transporter periplasmic adaptor subunit [Pirellulaceae bacterium]